MDLNKLKEGVIQITDNKGVSIKILLIHSNKLKMETAEGWYWSHEDRKEAAYGPYPTIGSAFFGALEAISETKPDLDKIIDLTEDNISSTVH
jgi:hypothetical protein